MKQFTKEIFETKRELSKLELFKLGVNSMILFLAFTISLQFFQFPWAYAILPPVFYFTARVTKRKADKRAIKKISGEYQELEEKLKTAYDNREDKKNEIVRDLLKDVSGDLGGVRSSKFLHTPQIFKKFALCIALTFILLSLNFFQFNIYSLGLGYDPSTLLREINSKTGGLLPKEIAPTGGDSERWEKSNYTTEEEKKRIGGEGVGGKMPGFSKGPIPGSGGGAGTKPEEDIRGEPTSAEVSGEEITMEMHPEYGGEIEIKQERIKKPPEEFSLGEAKGAKAPGKDPLKYEEIIKRYFQKILEEEEEK